MPAPKSITDLVARFTTNRESYCALTYKEAHVRQEFINPLFEALGWDMANRQDFAEAYKEVIHEDAVKVGAATKAPDYSFRVGGTRKFFVEAKTPSVNIKDDSEPAYQLRRYAWSAKLPLSILTDFEEFSVYSCREKPDKNDKASVGRILYIKCDEYEKRWDEIAAVFSKDAVCKGAYDKYAESAKGKKGTSTVDDEFLGEIERWRDMLAHTIALRNEKLSTRELNFAVQRTIDRIIFLRICEDRGIEHYSTLMTLLNGDNIYKRMRQNFQRADEIYNSGLFHFKDEKGRAEPPDTLTLSLNIDDKPLKDIIENLYYPESPYEFSVMPADILGQVYEQFLGKVIRLTTGHQAKVEDKPEVKKAGGVFYTPTYIVDYIVKNTVGKLVENKTPKQIEKLKILDPACGSGSFLIQAYQFLLDYHLDWYIKDGIEKHSKGKEPELVQVRSGEWRLATPERKKILLNNIHGVDIDSQAVEVTKLSLLLKVLEGENEQSLAQQMTLWHERALPDLENNIKCGNSLIGSDFYEGVQETMVLYEDDADEERIKINAFDWDGEHGFKEIMKSPGGGFDAVIGNPPWGADFNQKEKEYLVTNFPIVPTKTKDSYLYFISSSIKKLKHHGYLGFIVPNTWLLINNAKEFRKVMLGYNITEIIDFGDGVFKDAIVESSTFILSNELKSEKCKAIRIKKGNIVTEHFVDKSLWLGDDFCRIVIEQDRFISSFIKKLHKVSVPFDEKCGIIFGIKPYQVGYGIPPQTREMVEKRIYHSEKKRGKEWKPLVVGTDVNRYRIYFPGRQYIKYGNWLMYPSNEQKMLQPKIFLRRTSEDLRACYDEDRYYGQNSLFVVNSSELNLKYLLGLLNSRLFNFIYKKSNPQTGKIFAEIKPSVIKQLPIHKIDTPIDKSLHNKLVSLVTSMLSLHQKFPLARTDHEKTLLQRQIDDTDRRIDELVFELYGLTEEEIKIVEGKV